MMISFDVFGVHLSGKCPEEKADTVIDLCENAERTRTALKLLWGWAQEANCRLDYEVAEVGNVQIQFGGNPYLNPVFKLVREVLGEQS